VTREASERHRLRRLIEQAGVATLMNLDADGAHAGRPMLPLLIEHDPHIYFLTHQSSRKVAQLQARPNVGLSIHSDGCFMVVVGAAATSQDAELIRRLWHPTYRAWFPDGATDAEAMVIAITVDRIDYWEPPRSYAVRAAQAVKAMLTRRSVDTPMKTIHGL
jgi:general stress protein 26